MLTETQHIQRLARLTARLEAVDISPILIGGLALILLGSRRVTLDVDFLVSITKENLDAVLSVFYEEGFELASKVNDEGDIIRTIDNVRIASMRIRLDEPDSIFFLHKETGLRIDLLMDFPFPAAQILKNTEHQTIASHTFRVASIADLLKLKTLAYRDRKLSTDLQDIEFLKALQGRRKRRKQP